VRTLVVALVLALPIGLAAGAYFLSAPTITGADLQWLLREYVGTSTPPRSKPHAGIIISTTSRLPEPDAEVGKKDGVPVSTKQ
jgi:hypothetical protein